MDNLETTLTTTDTSFLKAVAPNVFRPTAQCLRVPCQDQQTGNWLPTRIFVEASLSDLYLEVVFYYRPRISWNMVGKLLF